MLGNTSSLALMFISRVISDILSREFSFETRNLNRTTVNIIE